MRQGKRGNSYNRVTRAARKILITFMGVRPLLGHLGFHPQRDMRENQQRCHSAKLCDKVLLHLHATAKSALEESQKRVQRIEVSKDIPE